MKSGWEVRRAKYLFRDVAERGFDLPLASVTKAGGVEFRADLDISVWNPGDDTSLYKRVCPGDFVIGLRSFQSGLGYSSLEGLVSPAYTVLRPRVSLEAGYYRHYFKSALLISQLENVAQGIRQGRTINTEDFYNLRVPVPPMDEQQAIARFLDRELAEMDAVEAQLQRVSSLLSERLLCATAAVLRGAGISGQRVPGPEWLGSIPETWTLAPVAAQFEVQLGRMLNAERAHGVDLRPYVRNINVRWDRVDVSDVAVMDFPPSERKMYVLRSGDLLVNEGGAGVGRAAVWRGEIDECYFQKSVHRVRARGAYPVEWLLEFLRVAVAQGVPQVEGNLATIPHMTAEAFRRYRVPLPPPTEVQPLLDELAARRSDINKALSAAQRQLDVLAERRQVLITEAVTGQIGIPEAAA